MMKNLDDIIAYIVGLGAITTGVSFYDWRAGLIVFGIIVLGTLSAAVMRGGNGKV